jgi:hypothetical protein
VQWAHHGSVDVAALHGVFDAWHAARPGISVLALASEHAQHEGRVRQAVAPRASVPLAAAHGDATQRLADFVEAHAGGAAPTRCCYWSTQPPIGSRRCSTVWTSSSLCATPWS